MKNFIQLAISLLVFFVGICTYHYFSQKQKLGFVKTGVILQKYQGMLDANNQFESEVDVVRSNVDTLRARFERLKAQVGSVPSSKQGELGYALGIAEKEYMQYNEASQQQLQQRQQQLTMDVLGKVNSYIQEFGKENHYKIIFGTTNDGSILYGLDEDDLTETILKDLNEIYKKPEVKK